jgi:hypothetical protein
VDEDEGAVVVGSAAWASKGAAASSRSADVRRIAGEMFAVWVCVVVVVVVV